MLEKWQSVDSLVNEDGNRGLAWRHELSNDIFECASVDAARALENFSASRRASAVVLLAKCRMFAPPGVEVRP